MTNKTGTIARLTGVTVCTVFMLGFVLLSAPRPILAQAPPALTGQQSLDADSGGLFTLRRALGVAFLVGSAALVQQGNDFKDEADEFYDSYESATVAAEIEKFYQRTTNRDVKSQVSWALAAAFGITGLRLALTGDGTGAVTRSNAHASTESHRDTRPSLSLTPAVTRRVVGLRLQHDFF